MRNGGEEEREKERLKARAGGVVKALSSSRPPRSSLSSLSSLTPPPYLALLDDVIWVGPREARRLQQVHDFRLGHVFPVEGVFIFLEPDRAAQTDFRAVDGEAAVGVVKDDFHVGGRDGVAGALLKGKEKREKREGWMRKEEGSKGVRGLSSISFLSPSRLTCSRRWRSSARRVAKTSARTKRMAGVDGGKWRGERRLSARRGGERVLTRGARGRPAGPASHPRAGRDGV